jgi:hypothetical protein
MTQTQCHSRCVLQKVVPGHQNCCPGIKIAARASKLVPAHQDSAARPEKNTLSQSLSEANP